MNMIEFHARVKDGSIKIPRKYWRDLTTRVHVILLAEKSTQPTGDLVDELLAHPIQIQGFRPLTREQSHARQAS